MSAFLPPRYDNGIMALWLGELFGIDPRKLTDYSVEGYADSPEVMVTIEAKMRVPVERYFAMRRGAEGQP